MATEEREAEASGDDDSPRHDLPDEETCRNFLSSMLLIRRFEERAGEMYAKAKLGGFLHLAIGEEATIVGAVRAMRDSDYLISTYREHGQALTRGTEPKVVMAELFGRVDGCSGGRGGSMHLFDCGRRFMGGYGIVGGSLPLSAGLGLAADYAETDDAVISMFGDGAINQGTFGETMNLTALWSLPVVFLVINNQFGMGTKLERHSAVTDLSKRGEGFGISGTRCDGMDVLDVNAKVTEALRKAREDREPQLVEAITYRFRGHSMADPEEYRSKEEVEQWRGSDPVETFKQRLMDEGVVSDDDAEKLDSQAMETIDAAVDFADNSPFPELDSLYDDLYVFGDQVKGWLVVDERSPQLHRGEHEKGSNPDPYGLAEAGAAYAREGDAEARRKRHSGGGASDRDEASEDTADGEAEPSAEERDEEGGGD
ncbi:MAG: pyruvate dehydrogenase (acetyl-transferring) E1 component subunit alpha [Thermoleophilaceae bacterium]|jgi:pyruvate dehydrogenase E1 component alpha subunit|nr:pyruvate dehydrogenase (acetyl-transferring) E1 component subunit alpha [Thermoleophilaceae bacterium]